MNYCVTSNTSPRLFQLHFYSTAEGEIVVNSTYLFVCLYF